MFLNQILSYDLTMNLGQALKTEFEARKARNTRYSLRSFAKHLDLDPTGLLRIMREERLPSITTAKSILQKLKYSPAEIDAYLSDLHKKLISKRKPASFRPISAEHFEKHFDTRHILLLEALQLKGVSFKQISAKAKRSLKLNATELQKLLTDLEQLGAILIGKNSVEVLEKNLSTVSMPFTSKKRKSLQQEFLKMSSAAIESYDLNERENATLTVPLHKDDFAKAKEILANARRRINALSAKRKLHHDVYNVATALYPVVK